MQSTQGLRPYPLFDLVLIHGHDDGDPVEDGAGGGDDNDGSDKSGGADKSTSEIRDPKARIAALEAEKERQHQRRQDAERERDELKTWKEEQERKSRTDEENRSADLKKATETNDQLSRTVNRLVIENAFLKDSSVSWRSVGDALALTDLSEVQIDEKTGAVKNPEKLTEAIAKTAKEKPYLLVEAKSKDDDEDPITPPTSGQPPAGKKTNGSNIESLKAKYPALRSH